MKYLFLLTLCCLMCLLSACGSGFPHELNDTRGPAVACPPERIPIRFGVPEGELSVYAPLATAFNAQASDMCVTVVPLYRSNNLASANITEEIIASVRQADVVELFRHELDNQTEPLFLDLRPLLEADASFEHADYFPNALHFIGPDQRLYWLPRSLRSQVIYYNQDLWNARGLPAPDATWTWEQVLDAATTLTTRDGLNTTVYGLHDINYGLTTALFLLDAQDVPFASLPEDAIDLTQPIYHTTVDQVAALAEAGVLYLDETDLDAVPQQIRAGKIAMWWDWSIDQLAQDGEVPFPVGVIPMPPLDSYFQHYGSGYLINRATLYPTQAWRWLAFLSQQSLPPTLTYHWGAGTEYPPRRSLVAQPGIEEQYPPAMQTALAGMAERPRQPVPVGHDIYPQLDSLARALEQVVLDGVAVAPALREAQTNLQQQVAELRQTPTVLVAAVPVNTPVVLNVPPGATVITFAAPNRDDPRWQPVIDRFQAAHPTLVIQLMHSSPGASNSDLAAQADCFVTTDTDTSAVFPSLRDLHPLLEADPTFAPEDYLPGLLTPRADQRLYVLPYEIGLQPLIYQPQRFDQAGLAAPTAAWTLADLLAAATHLTQPAQQQYGFAASLPLLHVDALLAQAGASRTSGAGDDRFPTFTTPATVSALQPYIALLRDAGPPLPADPETASTTVAELIAQGQVALWLDTGAKVFPIMPTQQQYRFPIALAPPPFPQAVTVRQGLAISAQTSYPEACWQWIADLSREPLLIQGDWPARASVVGSEVVQQQATPGALAVYQAYQQARVRLPAPTPDSFRETPLTMYWFNQAIQQAIRGAELGPALAAAQRLTERHLQCVHRGGTAAECVRQVDPAAPDQAL